MPKYLLRVDIDSRQPAAKARMRVIPAHHHLWPDIAAGAVGKSYENWHSMHGGPYIKANTKMPFTHQVDRH